jgi:hypothetical protein
LPAVMMRKSEASFLMCSDTFCRSVATVSELHE